jgi:uncharacterized protein (DUF433 family)
MGTTRHERITSHPDVMLGKPVIRGTRIPVELLLDKLGRGMSVDELLQAYPQLDRNDVLAALRFAADWLRLDEIEFGAPAAA